MTDEVFRDSFSDDIFRSMKAQMEPSDDTVASLLAMIAAEAPSSATESDNVIPFRTSAEITAEKTAAAAAVLESAPRKHFAKKKNKSIWYYGTAVAASIIVMISTFALLGTDGDDASGVKDLFDQAVGSNTQVVTPDNSGTEGQNPVSANENDSEVNAPVESEDPGQQSSAGGEEPSGSTDTAPNPQNQQSSEKEDSHEDPSDINDDPDEHPADNPSDKTPDQDSTDTDKDSGKDSKNDNDAEPVVPDNGKITPGAEGTGEIAWTSEIISTSQVASITVSGSNYVVGNTISRNDVSATLETVTIEIPQTSSTNAVQLKAKVREVKNVSAAAMVALDVEGFSEPLVYANPNYTPSSVGDMVSDLGLQGSISFSKTVRGQITRMGYSSNHNYSKDINSAVWEYLLNQSSAPRADYNSFSGGASKLLFTSGSNPTGQQMQFGVSDNGYLYVQMLGKKHTFHIGAENAKGFIEYVTGEPLE